MLVFYAILCLVLCAGVDLYSVTGSGYYNCENGEYDTLYHTTEECRRASYTPYLRELRKNQNHVSGKDIVDMLQNYCMVTSAVAGCVEGYINDLPCLTLELDTYRAMNRRSDWYCENDTVREVISNIYNDLPMQILDYKTNECYKKAPGFAYQCSRRFLTSVTSHKDRHAVIKNILRSFNCTYRKLHKVCGREATLLLITLEYDWLLIPPALGFNVSHTITTAARITFA